MMLNPATFVAFIVFFALAISGRRLREKAFRLLTAEQKAAVIDKMVNYTSTEMIPFAALVLGFVATLIFSPGLLEPAFGAFLVAMVLLTAVFHARARRRFSQLGLPGAFLSEYENSRIVTYSALAIPLGLGAWVLYL